ncbi:unnamed protein product, partial [marine sediment metagenome]
IDKLIKLLMDNPTVTDDVFDSVFEAAAGLQPAKEKILDKKYPIIHELLCATKLTYSFLVKPDTR